MKRETWIIRHDILYRVDYTVTRTEIRSRISSQVAEFTTVPSLYRVYDETRQTTLEKHRRVPALGDPGYVVFGKSEFYSL